MKPSLLVWLVLATNAVAQSAPEATPAPRPRLTEELRRASEGVAPAENAGNRSSPTDRDAVVMAPFAVTDSSVRLYTQPKAIEPADNPFTWTEGGTVAKHEARTFTTEFKFQYNPFQYAPPDKKVDLLKISW